MKLSFREAKEKDWEVVLNLEKIASKIKYYSAITKEKDIKKYIKKSNVFIIEERKKPIGTVSYELKGKNHAYLDGLTVHPKYRKQGVATKANEFIMSRLKGVKNISFHTHPYNSAVIKIALDLGFRIEELVENKFGDGEPRLLLIKVK